MISVEQAMDKAQEVQNWIESACGDAAYSIVQSGWGDDSYDEWLKNGGNEVRKEFRADAYADALYSDVGFLQDFAGDRINDEGNGDVESMILIAMAIQDRAHSDLKKACENLIDGWIKRLNRKESNNA